MTTIDTNPGCISQDPAGNTVHLTDIVQQIQNTTITLQRSITEMHDWDWDFQQSTGARITTSMAEFGQLASNTEQFLDTINSSEQNRFYAIYNQAITKNEKQPTKYRKQSKQHNNQLLEQNRLVVELDETVTR